MALKSLPNYNTHSWVIDISCCEADSFGFPTSTLNPFFILGITGPNRSREVHIHSIIGKNEMSIPLNNLSLNSQPIAELLFKGVNTLASKWNCFLFDVESGKEIEIDEKNSVWVKSKPTKKSHLSRLNHSDNLKSRFELRFRVNLSDRNYT